MDTVGKSDIFDGYIENPTLPNGFLLLRSNAHLGLLAVRFILEGMLLSS
jgi:hypothetical protein